MTFLNIFRNLFRSLFVGKIRFRDVLQNFAALMSKEGYPFEFESVFMAVAVFIRDPAWREEDRESGVLIMQ